MYEPSDDDIPDDVAEDATVKYKIPLEEDEQ